MTNLKKLRSLWTEASLIRIYFEAIDTAIIQIREKVNDWNLEVRCELVLAVVVSLLLPLDGRVVHLVDQDHQVLHPGSLHKHRMFSGLWIEQACLETCFNKRRTLIIKHSRITFQFFKCFYCWVQVVGDLWYPFKASCSSLMSRRAMVYQPASRSKLLDLQSHDLDKWLNRLETEAVQLLQVLAGHVMGSEHFPLSPRNGKTRNLSLKITRKLPAKNSISYLSLTNQHCNQHCKISISWSLTWPPLSKPVSNSPFLAEMTRTAKSACQTVFSSLSRDSSCQYLRSSSNHVRNIRLVAGSIQDGEVLFLRFKVCSSNLETFKSPRQGIRK